MRGDGIACNVGRHAYTSPYNEYKSQQQAQSCSLWWNSRPPATTPAAQTTAVCRSSATVLFRAHLVAPTRSPLPWKSKYFIENKTWTKQKTILEYDQNPLVCQAASFACLLTDISVVHTQNYKHILSYSKVFCGNIFNISQFCFGFIFYDLQELYRNVNDEYLLETWLQPTLSIQYRQISIH